MRFRELLVEDITDDLAALKAEREALVHHWETVIKPSTPQGKLMPGGYSVHTAETEAFSNDPERGRFWELKVYPLTQKIEQLEAEIERQRRTNALQTKRGDVAGFDTSEVLYHGTDSDFSEFDRTKARTAQHIYTSPDLETAEGYGSRVYAVYGRQQPQADLTAEYCDYALMRRLHRRGGFKRRWGLSLAELTELVTDGQLYNYTSSSSLQDDVISTALSMGYKSVRISDGKPGGGFSDSVIFGDPADLQIIEEVE